jgi:class 3 adenylate cyclase/tetratricopeptide (TPR) repeat protein
MGELVTAGGAKNGGPRKPARADNARRGKARARDRSDFVDQLPTERKHVTILRVDLQGSTDLVIGLELEEAIERLVPAIGAMRAAVHAYNGIVHREMGDGLFAAFGAPIAEDLHAVMGCLAALDLVRRIEALDDPALRVRIGVHSGQVVVGARQLDLANTYELDGPPMILADRLQSVAEPNQILASAACRSLAEGYIRFGEARQLHLKGFPAPVTVHVVESAGELSKWGVASTRALTAFVGRSPELDRLVALASTTETEHGTRAAIVGEAGVGKSRLAREFLARLRERGWSAIEVECSPIVGQTPFALLKALLNGIENALTAEAFSAAQKELSPAEHAAFDLIAKGADIASLPAWSALGPRARNRAIVEATRKLASHLSTGGPCICLFEDLQWADEASSAALEALLSLADRQSLMILATVRTGGLPAWFERQSPGLVSLAPLPKAAGMALLQHLLGSDPRLDALKKRILDHTGGLPLFVEEVCRGLVESGVLVGVRGAFTPTSPDAALGVPLTVQGVIASRIDRLSPSEKRVLQAASAIGPKGPVGILKSLSAAVSDSFEATLSALFAATMLVPAPADAASGQREGFYTFPHELVRQVAYDAVVGPEKSALHARILASIETVGGGGDLERVETLVHHALLCAQWSKAADYAATIARQTFAQSALPDALRHYETALQAIDRLPPSAEREQRAIDLRIEARGAYSNVGKVRRWLELAEEAQSRAAAAGDRPRLAASMAVRAAALNFCGNPVDAIEAGMEAVGEAERLGSASWTAFAKYGLGQAYYVAGRYRQAIETLDAAQALFLEEGATTPAGGSASQAGLLCCMMSCLCHVARGDRAAAAASQAALDRMAAKEGRALADIAAGLGRGTLLLCEDRVAEADAALSGALELARRNEVNLFIPLVACYRGLAQFLLGNAGAAEETFAEASSAADALGHVSANLRAQVYRALSSASVTGKRRQAMTDIQAIGRSIKQQGFRPLQIEVLVAEATLHRLAGDTTSAERCEAEAQAVAGELDAEGALQVARRMAARLQAMGQSQRGEKLHDRQRK